MSEIIKQIKKYGYCQHFKELKISKKLELQQINITCKYCFYNKNNNWICLMKNCKVICCSKNNYQHLYKHYQGIIKEKIYLECRKNKSFHTIFMNIITAEIRCIQCSIQIYDIDACDNIKNIDENILDPFKFRIKIYPALIELVQHKIIGQLENPEGHRKINQGLVGLFTDKYNYAINAAIQFITHIGLINNILLNMRINESDQILYELKNIAKNIHLANFRTISSDKLTRILYQSQPQLKGYNSIKDPFEIFLNLLNLIHQKILYYKFTQENIKYGQDQWDIFNHISNIETQCAIFNNMNISIIMNYQCKHCKYIQNYKQKVFYLKLNIPKKRKKTKQIQKQLFQHRVTSPIKKRNKSLINIFISSQCPITIAQLLINFIKQPFNQNKNCIKCNANMKKNHMYFDELPQYLLIQINRINKQGIDETKIQFESEIIDLGPFTSKKNQTIIYNFQAALCLNKKINFSLLTHNSSKKQMFVFKNQNVVLNKDKNLNPYIICFKRKHTNEQKIENEQIFKLIENESEQELKQYLLPDFWLINLKNNITCELSNQMVCKHKKIKPFIQSLMDKQILVTLEIFHILIHKYGGWQYCNQICKQCIEQVQYLNLRKLKQKQIIATYDKFKTRNYCMISVIWLKKWSNYLYSKQKISYFTKGYPIPGPIDNKILLNGNKCKADLKKNTHYKVINIFLWRFLKQLYNGGPQIRYKWTKNQSQNLDIEMLKEIKIKVEEIKSIYQSEIYDFGLKKSAINENVSSYVDSCNQEPDHKQTLD